MNSLEKFAVATLAALMLAGALFFGLVVLMVLGVIFALAALFFQLRTRWFGCAKVANTPAQTSGQVIDAEYTVVSRRDE